MSTQKKGATAQTAKRTGNQVPPAEAEPQPEDDAPSPRKPAQERADAFNMLAWLAEGAVGMLDELRHNDLGLPKAFWGHAYAARRESLLAARAFLDHVLAQGEMQANQEEERQQRRGNINIDF